jgi:capsule polysaccharide export protein KpsE/RkpR
MMESITLAAAQAIAKVALDKFVEGGAGELGKTSSQVIAEKVMQLGRVVWNQIKGNAAAVTVLKGASEEQPEEERKLKNYLYALWKNDNSEFVQEVKKLADEIHLELTQIEDNSMQIQNNYGGTNSQNRISGGTVYQGNITINQAPTD